MHETIHVGLYVIFGVIMIPVYAMLAGWIVGKPRDFRTVAITVGYVIAIVTSVVVALAALDLAISLLISA